MNYYQPKLRIFKNEILRDKYGIQCGMAIQDRDLVNLDDNISTSNDLENIDWAHSVWNFALFRSLEIWKELDFDQISRSLGGVTKYAQRSLSGKLGSGNGKYYKRNEKGKWVFIYIKQTHIYKEFKPLTDKAIGLCQLRARKHQ